MNDFNCPEPRTYQGEKIVDIKDTPFKNYTKEDWAMYFISSYGQIDGEHHKTWCLDVVAQILKGSPIEVSEASWSNGYKEYRVKIKKESKEYQDWVKEMKGEWDEENEEYEYTYNKGIAP